MHSEHETVVFCETFGSGPDLVLLHGWGLNGAAWQPLIPLLQDHFCVHVIDLPGFGYSGSVEWSHLSNLARAVLAVAPLKADWVGWSMGGLFATRIATLAPGRVRSLTWMASTPKFVADSDWPGIKSDVLEQFQQELSVDYKDTLERFLAIQTLGSETAREDLRTLRHQLLMRPAPGQAALAAGLELLAETDLRDELSQLACPLHRHYGRLDSLVPERVRTAMAWPAGSEHLYARAAHAPFISAPQAVAETLIADLLGPQTGV